MRPEQKAGLIANCQVSVLSNVLNERRSLRSAASTPDRPDSSGGPFAQRQATWLSGLTRIAPSSETSLNLTHRSLGTHATYEVEMAGRQTSLLPESASAL